MYAFLILAALGAADIKVQLSPVTGTPDIDALIEIGAESFEELRRDGELLITIPAHSGAVRRLFVSRESTAGAPAANAPPAGFDRAAPNDASREPEVIFDPTPRDPARTTESATVDPRNGATGAPPTGLSNPAPSQGSAGQSPVSREGAAGTGAPTTGITNAATPQFTANPKTGATNSADEPPTIGSTFDANTGGHRALKAATDEDVERDKATPTPEPPKNWSALVAALVALCGSLGLNLYLGYMWMELRLRYRQLLGAAEAVA